MLFRSGLKFYWPRKSREMNKLINYGERHCGRVVRALDMKCNGPGFKLFSLLLTKFVLGYIELAALCILSTGLPFASVDFQALYL